MTMHDAVQGLYLAWLFLAFLVVPISLTAFFVFREQDGGGRWLAAGIFSVWFWSALAMQPWRIYVRHALKDDPSRWTFLGNHPVVMLCIVGVISGGLMLVLGFTQYRFGHRFASVCAALTFGVMLLGTWLSSIGVL